MNSHYMLGALPLCIAALLASCGGGGREQVLQATPPPAAGPPPPTPPSPPTPPPGEPCPAPLTGPCIVVGQPTPTFDEYGMTGGRQSAHSLSAWGGDKGGGWVNLKQGEYRFDGGTTIAGTTLVVWDTLASNVLIQRDYTGLGFLGDSELWLMGTVRGNVVNEQLMTVRCWSGIHDCPASPVQRIEGNYTQKDVGTLAIGLGHPLQVTGVATLAGTLELQKGSREYVLPQTPTEIAILHADGGVVGRFDRWTSPSLFIEGAPRYGTHDVWFGLTRVSLEGALAAQGVADPVALAGAARLDRVLSGLDALSGAARDSQEPAQARLMASATELLYEADVARARRSVLSLTGQGHAQLALSQLARPRDASAERVRHASERVPGGDKHWSGTAPYVGASAYGGGHDRWLHPRLLVGSSMFASADVTGFDGSGGSAQSRDRWATAYAHYRGTRWMASAAVTAAHSQQAVTRDLPLGGRMHVASSHRSLSGVALRGELARALDFAGGTLQPMVAVDYSNLHASAFTELGDTGFELAAASGTLSRWTAEWGARYDRQWRWGQHRVSMLADWRAVAPLAVSGHLPATFVGAPDTQFDLLTQGARRVNRLRLGFAGSMHGGWLWSLSGAEGDLWYGQPRWQLQFHRDL